MVLSFLYRRPARITRSESCNSSDGKTLSPSSPDSSYPARTSGIPDELSFERIISGRTCPPMTCRDFMKYLTYVEHAAENLQFYLWLRDYAERFDKLSANEKALSPKMPVRIMNLHPGPKTCSPGTRPGKYIAKLLSEALPGHIPAPRLAVPSPTKANPFDTPPQTPGSLGGSIYELEHTATSPFSLSESASLNKIDHKEVAAEAFHSAGMGWQPFTIQPFREEISRVIAIYIAEGSPRELNVSSRDRAAALHAMAHTTHPSALEPLRKTVEDALRYQAHPNFVRWSIRNGNGARVCFAHCLGIGTIIAAFIVAILLTLSDRPRGWRALAAIGWVMGTTALFAANKGMCVILNGLHHRHVRPWELWPDSEADGNASFDSKESFDSHITSNSYEDEPWVAKYEKRNVIRKIFDKEVWIEEPVLRQIQDVIFIQSIAVAICLSAILTIIFVVLPSGGYTMS